MRRWILVLSLLVAGLGAASPADAQVRDAEPACADITSFSAEVFQRRDLSVTVSLAAPSCAGVSYQVQVFAKAGDPSPVLVSTQEVAGRTSLQYHLVLPGSDRPPLVAVTSSSFLLRVTSSLLPPLTVGTRQHDREPDVGTVEAHRVEAPPPSHSLSFD